MKRATALMLLVLLSACGGGDPEEDKPDRTILPVDCEARPEICR
jgi:hypothetical protein